MAIIKSNRIRLVRKRLLLQWVDHSLGSGKRVFYTTGEAKIRTCASRNVLPFYRPNSSFDSLLQYLSFSVILEMRRGQICNSTFLSLSPSFRLLLYATFMGLRWLFHPLGCTISSTKADSPFVSLSFLTIPLDQISNSLSLLFFKFRFSIFFVSSIFYTESNQIQIPTRNEIRKTGER